MQRRGAGPPPNVVVYTAALDACAQAGQTGAGLALFKEMQQRRLEPDGFALAAAAGLLEASGQHREARALREKLASLRPVLAP